MRGASVSIGGSVANLVNLDMIRSMRTGHVVLPLANPLPGIMPADSLAGRAAMADSGRFDLPNQCNNVLAFPV